MQEKKRSVYMEGVGWRHEKEASMLRRMEDHDYRGRSIYMLTLVTEGRERSLGTLRWPSGQPEKAYIEPSTLGRLVERCWNSIADYYPGVKPLALQLMPDHLHGLLFITKEQEAHLGHIVKGFKIGCTHALRNLEASAPAAGATELSAPNYNSANRTAHGTPKRAANGTAGGTAANQTEGKKLRSVFASGYQDSVLTGKGQLERMFAYIADNPQRLAMKRLNPERFRIQSLLIAGRNCQLVGNSELLTNPDKRAVIVHRRYTDEENARLREEWLACGERGGVLVSAAIAPKEKGVLREAMNRGYKIILLRENGFPELYKPSGEAFYACAEGILLQISPWNYHTEKRTITREQCLLLNALAEKIAAGH
ncbi:MAG: hypothetical protein Q4D33_07035 [Prevotellaceae bacterium]|nr:hypothetical protein [Prevotellaceae bacterium]